MTSQRYITMGEQKLKVVLVPAKNEYKLDRNITDFGKLPQIEGQRVYWFMVPHVPQQPDLTYDEQSGKTFSLKIRYTQKLSHDQFIYTPLIPKQDKNKDYGSITITADKPLMLIDEDKHEFEKGHRKYVVEPSDKRGIVVQVAKVTPQIP